MSHGTDSISGETSITLTSVDVLSGVFEKSPTKYNAHIKRNAIHRITQNTRTIGLLVDIFTAPTNIEILN